MKPTRKYTRDLPQETCENCGKKGGMLVWVHVYFPGGVRKDTEGLRDCRICRGLPQ
jgi:hypothetical protein